MNRVPLKIAIYALLVLSVTNNAEAQQIFLEPSGDTTLGLRSIQMLALLTILSIAPGIAIMVTSFPFIVTVLSILRQAIGLQQAPPNMLIVSLSLFLTWFIMEPTLTEAWVNAIEPFSRGAMELTAAFPLAVQPFKNFMGMRIDPETLQSLQNLRYQTPIASVADAPLSLLIPAFMLSEIQRAFEIGFTIFVPFLIIDLVVSAILMSMGMMMLSPAAVSLPFKLAFFAVADGFTLIANALVRSYS